MKTLAASIMAVWMILALPAAPLAGASLTRADALFSSGATKAVLESALLYARFSDEHPGDYEAAWKASRSFRQYCSDAQGWPEGSRDDALKTYGRLGMKFGARAMSISPNRVEGIFWHSCSMAYYAQGMGTMHALREGLKDKVLAGFEKAYAIDRHYDGGGPIIALGRYWYVLPWPYHDMKKSLEYLREYQRLYPRDPEGQVYLAEVLMSTGRKAEARALLEKAASSGPSRFSARASSILKTR
jgi:tetratricopeptide (TPR) repeat protein